MAYVNQYELDMQQDARSNRNYAAIGDAVTGVIKNIGENRRRAIDEKRALEKQELLQTQAKKDMELKDKQLNKLAYEEEQRALNPLKRDDFVQRDAIAKTTAQNSFGIASKRDELLARRAEEADLRKQEAEGRKIENEKKQNLQKVAISDFDFHDPAVVPSAKDAEAVKGINAAYKNFSRTGKEIQDLLGQMEDVDYTGFTNRAKLLKQKIGEAQLQQKEIKKLGVLNGPDLPLVDKTLGDVGSMSTLMLLGKDAAKARMDEAIKNSRNNLQSEAQARGYRPRNAPEQAQNKAPTNEREELEMLRKLKQQSKSVAGN